MHFLINRRTFPAVMACMKETRCNSAHLENSISAAGNGCARGGGSAARGLVGRPAPQLRRRATARSTPATGSRASRRGSSASSAAATIAVGAASARWPGALPALPACREPAVAGRGQAGTGDAGGRSGSRRRGAERPRSAALDGESRRRWKASSSGITNGDLHGSDRLGRLCETVGATRRPTPDRSAVERAARSTRSATNWSTP